VRNVGLDDYFMLAALVVALALVVMNSIHVGWGTGQECRFEILEDWLRLFSQHGADLDFVVILVPTLKHWYAYQMVYPWALAFTKNSILAFYHRIFPQKNFRRMIYAVAGFVTVYTFVCFFVNVGCASLE